MAGSLQTQLEELQRHARQTGSYSSQQLLKEIFRVWNNASPKAQWTSNYSIVDEKIMEAAVSHAKKGANVYVASADRDITCTMEAYKKRGLPITVWKPQKLTKDITDGIMVDILVMGEVLQKLPEFVGSEAYKYYLKVAYPVVFEGGYKTGVAIDVEKAEFISKPARHPGIFRVRVVNGKQSDAEADLRRLGMGLKSETIDLVALIYKQRPGSFRFYALSPICNGQQPDNNGEKNIFEREVVDPDMRAWFRALRWARVDEDFIRIHSPSTLHMLRELKNRYPIDQYTS